MTTPQPPKVDWQQLCQSILMQRRAGTSSPSPQAASQWRKIRAALRKGSSETTAHSAFPYVLPHLDSRSGDRHKSVALALCALVAEYENIPEFQKTDTQRFRSVGQWCHFVSLSRANQHGDGLTLDPESPDAIASRLQYLHTLSAPEAVLAVRRIAAIASSQDQVPAMDFFQLFRTFFYWGDGLSAQSQRHRRRVLEDYYTSFSSIPTDSSTAPSSS